MFEIHHINFDLRINYVVYVDSFHIKSQRSTSQNINN